MFTLITIGLLGIIAGFALGVLYATWCEVAESVQFIEPHEPKDGIISTPGGTIEVTQFIESISPQEKFTKATNVSDLLNDNG